MDEERQNHGENIQIGGKRRSSLGALSKSKPVTKLKSMFEQKGAVPVNKDSHLLYKLPPVHATQDTALVSTTVAANISYSGPAPSLPPPAELPPATPSHHSCNFAPPPDVDAAVHPSPPLSADNLRTHNDSLQDGGEADTKWGKSPTSTGFLRRMGSSLKKALAPKSSAGKQKREACSPNCAGSEVSSMSPRPSGPLALTPASQPSSSSLDLNSRRDQMQSHPPQSPTTCMGYEILNAQEEQDWSNERSRGGSSEVCLPVSVNDIAEDVAMGAADAEAEIHERVELMSSTCMETSEPARPAQEMPPSVDCGPSYDVPLSLLPSSDATVEHTEPRQPDAEDMDWDADALNPTSPSTGGATPLPVHVDIATCAVTAIADIPPASDDSPCVHEQAGLFVPSPGSPRKASTPSVLPTNGHNMEDSNDAGAFGSEMSETAHWSAAGQTTDPESAGHGDPSSGPQKLTPELEVVVEAPTNVELLGSRQDTDLPPCGANSGTPSTSQEFDAVCQPTSTEVATPVGVAAIDSHSPSSAGVTNPPSPIDEVAAEVTNPPSPIHEVPSDIVGQVVSVPLHVEDSGTQAAYEVSSDGIQVVSAPLPESHAVCQLGSPEKLGDAFQPQQPDPIFDLSTVADMEIATPTLVLPVSASPPSSTAEVLPDDIDQAAAAPFTEVAGPEPQNVLGAEHTKQDSLPPVPESATVCQPMLIEEMSEDILLGAIPACQPGNDVAMEVGPLPDATSESTSSHEVSTSATPVGPAPDATSEPISIKEVSASDIPVAILPDLRNDVITDPVGQLASEAPGAEVSETHVALISTHAQQGASKEPDAECQPVCEDERFAEDVLHGTGPVCPASPPEDMEIVPVPEADDSEPHSCHEVSSAVTPDASSPDLKPGDDHLLEPLEDAVAEAIPQAADAAFEPSTSESIEVASELPLTDALEFHTPPEVSANVKEVALAPASEVVPISQPTIQTLVPLQQLASEAPGAEVSETHVALISTHAQQGASKEPDAECQPVCEDERFAEDVLHGTGPVCPASPPEDMEVVPVPEADDSEPHSCHEVSSAVTPDASSPDLKPGDVRLLEPVEDAVAEAIPQAADPAFEPSTSEGMEVASGLPLTDAFEFHAPLEVTSGLTLTDAFKFHAPLEVSADVKEVALAPASEVNAISPPTFADKMDEEDMQPAAASQGHPTAAAVSVGSTKKLRSAQPSMECDYDLVAYGSAASELSHWGTNAAVSTTTDADAAERASVLQSSTSFFAAANEEMLRACTSVPAPASYEPDLTDSMAASPLRSVSPQFDEAVLDDPMIVSPMPPQSLRLSLAHALSSDPLTSMTALPVHGIMPDAQSTMAVEVHDKPVPLAACVIRQLSAEHAEPPMNQAGLVATVPSFEPCGPPAVTTFHEVPPAVHELTGYMNDVAIEATDALPGTVHASNIGEMHVDTAVSENVPLADTLESFEAMWGNDNLLADTDKDESGLCSPLPMPLVVSSPVKQPEPYPASTHKVAPDVVLQVPRESLDLFSLRNSCTARVSDSLMVESLDGFEAANISAKARGIAFVPMAPLREASEHEDAPESPVAFRSNGGAEGAPVSDGGAPPTVALTPALQPGNLVSGGAGTPSANRPAAMVRQAPTPHTAGKAGSAPASRAGTPGGPHAAAPSTALKALAAATGATSAGKSSAAKRSAPGSRAAAHAHASNSTSSGGRTLGTSASNTPKQATPMMPGGVGASGTAHMRAGFTPRSAGVFSGGARAQSAVGDRPAQPPAVGLPSSASMGLFDTPTLQRAAAVPLTDSPFGCDFDLDTVDISAEASMAIAVLEGGQQKAMAGNLRTPPVAVNSGSSGLPGTPTVSFLETHVLLLTSKLAEAEAKSHQLQEENTMLRDQLSTLQFESSMTNDLDMEREARQFLEQELAVVRHRADALDADLHTAQNELKQRTEAMVLLEARLEQMIEEQRVRDEAEVRKQRAHEESRAQLQRAHEDSQAQLQRARDEAEAKFQKAMEQLIAAQTTHKRQTVEYEQKIQQQNSIIAQFVELRDKFRQMKQHVMEADQRVHAADQRAHLAENKVQEATAALNMALAEKAELMRMCNELLTQLEVSKARGR